MKEELRTPSERDRRLDSTYLIDMEDLDMEDTPLAAGGGGQVRLGKCFAICSPLRQSRQPSSLFLRNTSNSQVYRGNYAGNDVAIKSFYSQMMQTSAMDEVLHEATMLAQLHHPRITRFFGIARKGPIVYEVCPFLPCGMPIVNHGESP